MSIKPEFKQVHHSRRPNGMHNRIPVDPYPFAEDPDDLLIKESDGVRLTSFEGREHRHRSLNAKIGAAAAQQEVTVNMDFMRNAPGEFPPVVPTELKPIPTEEPGVYQSQHARR